MRRILSHRDERWPIAGGFRISRGARTHAEVIVAEIEQDGLVGRGECVPYPRYGETLEGTRELIESLRPLVDGGLHRADLQAHLPAGAARNALDCALWDLEAKLSGVRASELAGLAEPRPVVTAFTLSLDEPGTMAEAAGRAADRPLLKLKLGGDGDDERVRAVRAMRSDARLIVDANEAWTPGQVEAFLPVMAACGVELVEQPLPAGEDEALRGMARPVPIGADESCHARPDLERLAGLYEVVNVKLDKTGGLTEALALVAEAEAAGFGVMIGCMVGTSLAMAPALLLTGRARFVDLDGPLLLESDREPGLRYDGATVAPAPAGLWG